MASRSQKAAGVMAAVLASCAIAAPVVVSREGWVTKTYADPVAIQTACAGVTKGVVPGKTYTDAQCEQMTAQALVEHGLAIAQCLPERLPDQTRAAFTSFAYNIGAAGFCKSRVAVLARAGNLGAACGALRLYVYAGGRKLPGLVTRRAEEQALCEKGLKLWDLYTCLTQRSGESIKGAQEISGASDLQNPSRAVPRFPRRADRH